MQTSVLCKDVYLQMGLGSGWGGSNAVSGGWMGRNACSREHMRYPADCRPLKVSDNKK